MARVFLIKTTENNEYFFELRNDNNEIILRASETYKTEKSCYREIETVLLQVLNDCNYTKYNDVRGRPSFRLRGPNNKIIGLGGPYNSMAARDKGIENVKKCAMNAPAIKDLIK